MKIKNIIDEVLLEKKAKNLRVFFKTDIFVQEFPEKEDAEEEPVRQTPEKPEVEAQQPAVAVEDTKNVEELINEDIHKFNSVGELVVPEEDANNIQTMEDLLDYLSDKSVDDKKILDNFIIEIAKTLSGVGAKPLEEVVHKGDKILVDVDYGVEKENSIGFKILKNAGSDSITITMKKDSKVVASPFDLPTFNKQLIYFRNSLI